MEGCTECDTACCLSHSEFGVLLAGSAAINHGVFSRGLGGNASSTRALEMGKGEISNWAEMCATGLKLIDAANNQAKL